MLNILNNYFKRRPTTPESSGPIPLPGAFPSSRGPIHTLEGDQNIQGFSQVSNLISSSESDTILITLQCPSDTVGSIKCHTCSNPYANLKGLKKHLKKHSEFIYNYKHICDYCGITYERLRSMTCHQRLA